MFWGKVNHFNMNIKKIYVAIVILLFPLSVFATPQAGDILIWKGDTLALFATPLELREGYDSLIEQISNEIERELRATYPEKTETDLFFISSACWRGYRAEWILLNDSIFLNNIYPCYYSEVKINLKNVFPNIRENQKIFASWINGDLFVPQGECIQYVHAGYESIYELETVLSVENGLLKNFEVFHNRIAKRSAFFNQTRPGEVLEFTHKNIKWNNLPDLTNKLIQVNLSVNLNEYGQVESLNEEYTHYIESYLNESTQKIDSSKFVLDAGMNDVFIKESFRIAKLIPEWDVIYQRGKVVGSGLYMEFSEEKRKEYEP
jgi:hypothetical protein